MVDRMIKFLLPFLFLSSVAMASYVIPDGAVTTPKLATSAVIAAKIATAAVTTPKISDGNVTQAKKAIRTTGTSVAAGGIAISASTSTFTTTSGSFTPVTNASVTIVTLGNPVDVYLIPDGGSLACSVAASRVASGQNTTEFQVKRGASVVGVYTLNSNASFGIAVPCSAIHITDLPSAGTYTYTLEAREATGADTALVSYSKLVAVEQ